MYYFHHFLCSAGGDEALSVISEVTDGTGDAQTQRDDGIHCPEVTDTATSIPPLPVSRRMSDTEPMPSLRAATSSPGSPQSVHRKSPLLSVNPDTRLLPPSGSTSKSVQERDSSNVHCKLIQNREDNIVFLKLLFMKIIPIFIFVIQVSHENAECYIDK